jgi:hypothetical protein
LEIGGIPHGETAIHEYAVVKTDDLLVNFSIVQLNRFVHVREQEDTMSSSEP